MRRRNFRKDDSPSERENVAEERCSKLEQELDERITRMEWLTKENEQFKRRILELEKLNGQLLAQVGCSEDCRSLLFSSPNV